MANAALLAILWTVFAAPVPAQPASPLQIASITVTPAKPGPDTLCQLKIELANSGDKIASQLAFAVRLNGQNLGVYGNQVFMVPVPPKGKETVELFNFWTTETSRSMPADAKMKVEVELLEAEWMSITTEREGEGEGAREVETWRPLGAVEALPVTRSVTLEMTRPAKRQ